MACIHTPPPPPNQIVYVVLDEDNALFMLIAGFGMLGTAMAADQYPSEVTLFKDVNIFNGVSDQLKMGYDSKVTAICK